MIGFLQRWLQRLNQWAWLIGLTGFVGIAWHNWRLWQKDKAILDEKSTPPPLPPLEQWPSLPLVTVLVAAWNESDHIDQHIESFLNLRYPHKELILCAGGEDDTYERAQAYAGNLVKVFLQQAGEGKQRSLARCLPKVNGDIVYLTDADCLLHDDAVEKTIHPLVVEQEKVCTGSSQPLPKQSSLPFVAAQLANQSYSRFHAPKYTPGLLGRNCAVKYDLLKKSEGLLRPAPTGTDYVLAKSLIQAGARIRHVPESQIFTQYPEEEKAYIRQQSRWLKNHLIWGRHYRDKNHIQHALLTILAGVGMLISSILALVARQKVGYVLISFGWAGMLFSRLRYERFASQYLETSVQTTFFNLLRVLVADLLAWSRTFIDIWHRKGRVQW